MNAVGHQIFAGGFSYGVIQHFNVLAHLELGTFGVGTFALNFPDVPIYIGQERWPVNRLQGIDLMFCNCPCVAWSAAGGGMKGRDNWRTDPRVEYSRTAFDLFHELQPRALVWESVPRAFSCGRDFIVEQAERALAANYHITIWLFNLAHHGLPQRRQRGFFIATRTPFDLDGLTFRDQPVTVGEALAGTVDDHHYPESPARVELFKNTPPGKNCRERWEELNPPKTRNIEWIGTRSRIKGRPPFMSYRLDPNQPCGTLTSHIGQVHPYEPRTLSVDEVRALCGYPRGMRFAVPPNKRFAELTQAVTPTAGELVARFVKQSLKREETLPGDPVIINTTKKQFDIKPLFI